MVFFDIRNRGRSDPVPDGRVGLPVEVDDIDDVRATLGFERCSLFAWSYPALMAALYAARNAERVDRLILSCPPPVHAEIPSFFTVHTPRTTTPSKPVATADEARAQRRALAGSLMWNRAGVGRLRSDPGAMRNEWPDHVASAMDRVRTTFPERFDFRSEIRTITAPTLILHGARDGTPVAAAEELSELIPDARLVVFADVGHLPHVEAPEKFSRHIDEFLAG